ncbi:hypothetical protein Q5P01_016746 [Channa striata]|uniref:Uncharacterized protein n=1 Tax=Channa striata TaxID=64152 RepID=A0AA88MBX1_CHASR|nr:hypothetical protein Q5P01_016746 [Channa striata]
MFELDRPSQSSRLDGHSGSMTWRILANLFLFALLIHLSKEKCFEYFRLDKWIQMGNLTQNFTLVKPKKDQDLILCTLKNECETRGNACFMLHHCFDDDRVSMNLSEICHPETSRKISFYNFMCSVAKHLHFTSEDVKDTGCQYNDYSDDENSCQIFNSNTTCGDQTTTLPTPTTTLQETTKTPTTILQEATLSSTLSTTTSLPPPTRARTLQSQLKATLTTTQNTVTGSSGAKPESRSLEEFSLCVSIHRGPNRNPDNTKTLLCCLAISLALNVILPIAVYLCMRKKTRGLSRTENGGRSEEPQPNMMLQPVTLLQFENRDQVENMQLL